MRGGVARLMTFALKEQARQLEKNLPGLTQAAMQLRAIGAVDDIKADLLAAIVDRAFIGEDELPRNEKGFETLKQRAKPRLPVVRDSGCRLLTAIAEEYHRAQQRLAAGTKAAPQAAADIKGQIARLVYKGFLRATPWERLHDIPRYLKATQMRLDKYPKYFERDSEHAAKVGAIWKRYEDWAIRLRKAGESDPRVEDFRWSIEELRVSLWAQELKTPYPVSYKRLDRLWSEITRT
jgi:ATP-dependent helicase HrpA